MSRSTVVVTQAARTRADARADAIHAEHERQAADLDELATAQTALATALAAGGESQSDEQP